ncbi:hypothetical protein [Actinomadura algeriensis]|uniref:Tfp pilus assembly protein FimT n=1 Tax=Actinomadura algeriensis TaxID=1679523 RepID=A0ABR9JW65_9ACTN|nr:hypothetical protein [Actinomadura algeriensis]MBE1534804.1 Tfp pilus assembly protein FimT [Actinomadura algeriensis]
MTAVERRAAPPGPDAPDAAGARNAPDRAAPSARRLLSAPVPAPTGLRRLVPRTAASRIRGLSALVVVVLLALLAVTAATIAQAREGMRVIGHDAGPQVVATGDLYSQLTDMDAQLANALLAGDSEPGVRAEALELYDLNRLRAGEALIEAAKLADDPIEEDTARALLDALARYERLAGQALLLERRTQHQAGPPPEEVLTVYQQATDLMKLDLLPKAYNLTLDNGALVRETYEEQRSAVLTGLVRVIAVGVLLLVTLVVLQVFLAVRFRRLLNAGLALATVGALALVTASGLMLWGQAESLRNAKEQGFDSILALSRTRAISNNAAADQTRYLLDPGRIDTYEQVYLNKSKTILYVSSGSLAEYNTAVKNVKYDPRGGNEFLGFLGTEADRPVRDAATRARIATIFGTVIQEYQRFQQLDHEMRRLVESGERGRAVAERGGPTAQFRRYDRALQELEEIRRDEFDAAIAAGDGGTRGWYGVLPIAGVVIVAFLLIGVWPRLSEYRWSK